MVKNKPRYAHGTETRLTLATTMLAPMISSKRPAIIMELTSQVVPLRGAGNVEPAAGRIGAIGLELERSTAKDLGHERLQAACDPRLVGLELHNENTARLEQFLGRPQCFHGVHIVVDADVGKM